jgi:hypothetical protein
MLEANLLENDPESQIKLGTVYRFVPSATFPKLRLANDRRPDAPLRAIIRRSTIVVVKEKNDDNWWFVNCSGTSKEV